MSSKARAIPEDPEDEIIDDDDEGVTEAEFLSGFLQTEEGETLTQVLDKISQHLESQNKILIKMLTVMMKSQSQGPCPCPCPAKTD